MYFDSEWCRVLLSRKRKAMWWVAERWYSVCCDLIRCGGRCLWWCLLWMWWLQWIYVMGKLYFGDVCDDWNEDRYSYMKHNKVNPIFWWWIVVHFVWSCTCWGGLCDLLHIVMQEMIQMKGAIDWAWCAVEYSLLWIRRCGDLRAMMQFAVIAPILLILCWWLSISIWFSLVLILGDY